VALGWSRAAAFNSRTSRALTRTIGPPLLSTVGPAHAGRIPKRAAATTDPTNRRHERKGPTSGRALEVRMLVRLTPGSGRTAGATS
jgi:hypothetical protein